MKFVNEIKYLPFQMQIRIARVVATHKRLCIEYDCENNSKRKGFIRECIDNLESEREELLKA